MRSQSAFLVAAWLLIPVVISEGGTLDVNPTEPLSAVRDKLAVDPSIAEVVFAKGVYFGALTVEGPKVADFAKHPLLIRAADGVEVVFDGARPVEKSQPHEELPGVFWIDYATGGGEYPKFWEPLTRIRYRLVADGQAVARFPATYSIEGKRLLFHTSDGKAPRSGELLRSADDCGLFVHRPYVTVRGIAFRNYLAREKWSTGIDLRVNHITAEDCRASNCSMGFIITGSGNAVRRCAAEDIGGGVYVGGEEATVEDCRLLKQRDTFMVPMYAQDDTGIQYYSPARGGLIRGNLCEGFGMGVFIKAGTAPYVVEHNTLVGLGQGLGFGSTSWHPQQRFRYNIIADCERQVEMYVEKKEGQARNIDFNCYWSASRSDLKKVGAHDIVADPKFVWPQWRDYRLAHRLRRAGRPIARLHGPRQRPVPARARLLVLQQPECNSDAQYLRGEPLLGRRISLFLREFHLPEQQLYLPGQRRDRHRGEPRREGETGEVRLRLQQLRHRPARAAAGHAIRQRLASPHGRLPERRFQGHRQLHRITEMLVAESGLPVPPLSIVCNRVPELSYNSVKVSSPDAGVTVKFKVVAPGVVEGATMLK